MSANTVSPAVQRALDAQRAAGHAAKRFAEPTLGDRIRDDDRFEPSEAERHDIDHDWADAQIREANRGI